MMPPVPGFQTPIHCRPCAPLDLAGIAFDIQADPCAKPLGMDTSYEPFSTDREPDVLIRVRTLGIPKGLPTEGDPAFQAWDRWSLYRDQGATLIVQYNRFSGATAERVMILNRDRKTCDFFARAPMRRGLFGRVFPHPMRYPLGPVLMMCLLGEGRGLMVHACGIHDGEHGYLVVGNSGHGKSTLARQWENKGRILNDDRMVLRLDENGLWMYPTPWHGDYASVSRPPAPVDRIFILRRAEENRVFPLTRAAACSLLLARSFAPLWDGPGMGFTLDFLAEVTSRVPCCELSFTPDEGIVEFIRCLS
jgi:hypothetical protein